MKNSRNKTLTKIPSRPPSPTHVFNVTTNWFTGRLYFLSQDSWWHLELILRIHQILSSFLFHFLRAFSSLRPFSSAVQAVIFLSNSSHFSYLLQPSNSFISLLFWTLDYFSTWNKIIRAAYLSNFLYSIHIFCFIFLFLILLFPYIFLILTFSLYFFFSLSQSLGVFSAAFQLKTTLQYPSGP